MFSFRSERVSEAKLRDGLRLLRRKNSLIPGEVERRSNSQLVRRLRRPRDLGRHAK